MNGRLLAALIGIFAVGLLVGAIVGAAVSDSSDASPESPESVGADCDAASAVVDQANERIAGINESGTDRSADLFAALLSEQLAIVYAMDAEPTCFSLAERAAASGLADGLRVLALVDSPAAPAFVPDPAPPDDGGASESGDSGDPGE